MDGMGLVREIQQKTHGHKGQATALLGIHPHHPDTHDATGRHARVLLNGARSLASPTPLSLDFVK